MNKLVVNFLRFLLIPPNWQNEPKAPRRRGPSAQTVKNHVIASQCAHYSALRAAFGGCAMYAAYGPRGVVTKGNACGAFS